MSAVWKRPSLTALEIGWRWSFGLLAVAFVWLFAHDVILMWTAKLQDIQPILLRGHLVARGTVDVKTYLWPLLVAIAGWSVFRAFGRGAVLRRWDHLLAKRPGSMIPLMMLRAYSFAALLLVWLTLLVHIARTCVWTPMERSLEPSYVPGFAMAVAVTLLVFLLWATTSWILRIAPVLAMSRGLNALASLRAAVRIGPLRSKLVEINLVMGIVKVALIVLALVFSSCPLPFQSVESQTFLTCWWAGVGLLYLVASDYFHVVRAAAYDALFRLHESAS